MVVRVAVWVASAMLATPYTYAQYYSSFVAPACYMSRATLLRFWGKWYCKTLVLLGFRYSSKVKAFFDKDKSINLIN